MGFREKTRGKKAIKLALVFVLVLAAGVIAYNYLLLNKKEISGEEEASSYPTVELLKQEPVSIEGVAQFESDTSYFFDPSKGEIDQVKVKNGETVKKGDVLFTYKQAEIDEQVEDTNKNIEDLKTEREALVEALSKSTELSYNDRGDQIEEKDVNGETRTIIVKSIDEEDDLDSVDANGELSTRMQIKQKNSELETAETQLERLKKKQDSKVTAKFAGEVMLDELGIDDSSIPLVRIISPEDIRIHGSVTEYEYYLLKKDRPVKIYVNAEDRESDGKISDFESVPNAPSTNGQLSDMNGSSSEQMVKNVAETDAQYAFEVLPDTYIKPGFSVKIQIQMPGLLVPKDAIHQEGDSTYVYKLVNNKAIKTKIELEKQGNSKIAESGLGEGDILILTDETLDDGQEIVAEESTEEGDVE
ncbi:biotin/lipoyl-binding protein [Facklamia sp. DSM 111018]|uniref:Biotin/lipoyl-binding protein n=1 Tax=Facklamia lactis TaxID=2749967 RepID=A0ABS0LQB8_9LACT|nr:biotin/lipoyl-binding protein [Facklamia lactis]MBG9986350.1 biotin/lipoyl-binding protein [Facklamia lactis]